MSTTAMKTPLHKINLKICFSVAFWILLNALTGERVSAQNVGVNNPNPNPKAILDLTSSDKGMLTPRMTQAQRQSMFPVPDAASKGMIVYQTDATEGFYYYDGANWNLLSSDAKGWSTTGNAGTDPVVNFLGTTDNKDLVIRTNNAESIRVKNDGKVGIANSLPVQKLDVTGNINVVADSNYRIGNNRVLSVKGTGNLFTGTFSGTNNTTGYNNTFVGDSAGFAATTGYSNTAFGKNALRSNNGTWNTAVGVRTLQANTIGFSNTGVGIGALEKNTEGYRNTAVGGGALEQNTLGVQNISVGYFALKENTTGSWNSALGSYSLMKNTTGVENVAVGHSTLYNNLTGSKNMAIGNGAMQENTSGYENVAVGVWSLNKNTTGNRNVAVGNFSMKNNTTGIYNVGIGYNALESNTTGNANIAIGFDANKTNTTSGQNVFIGHEAGKNNSGWNNTVIGYQSGVNITGDFNSYYGIWSGNLNSTGHRNTFLGAVAGAENTTGSWNVFLGTDAGQKNTAGNSNVYIGFEAGLNSTTVGQNVFIGQRAGRDLTTGDNNTFVGTHAGMVTTTGYNNTFVGKNSGTANTTGFENAFFGGYAGWKNTTGSDNAFFGRDAGLNNLTGNGNAFFGEVSGINTTSGNANTFIGQAAGTQNTTGSNNVALGQNAQTGAALTNAVAIGANSSVTTSNSLVLGGTGANAVNVGIGTTAPAFPLSFNNNLGDKISLWGSPGNTYGLGMQAFLMQIYSGTAADDIAFGYGGSASFTERMRIKGNGNVGIGTNAPTSKLHIVGDAISVPLRIQNTLNNGYSGAHFHDNAGVIKGHLGYGNAGAGSLANKFYIGTTDPEPTVITTDDVERVRVDATGNVGIGTTAPTTKLEVNGFTKLGSDAPAIKVKKLTATTSLSQGTTITINTGIASAKILSVDVLVEYSAGALVPPTYNQSAGYEFNFYVTGGVIYIITKNGNSASILGKPVRALVTYEE